MAKAKAEQHRFVYLGALDRKPLGNPVLDLLARFSHLLALVPHRLQFLSDLGIKVRRHLAHARKRKGFCWKRWNRSWWYDTLRLFNGYRVRRDGPKAAPAG